MLTSTAGDLPLVASVQIGHKEFFGSLPVRGEDDQPTVGGKPRVLIMTLILSQPDDIA